MWSYYAHKLKLHAHSARASDGIEITLWHEEILRSIGDGDAQMKHMSGATGAGSSLRVAIEHNPRPDGLGKSGMEDRGGPSDVEKNEGL